MSYDNEKELYFENIGQDFNNLMSDYDVSRRVKIIVDILRGQNAPFEKGVEVGCGTGKISQNVLPFVEDYTVTDISAKLASDTGERLGCKGRQENACDLSFTDETFDLVVSSECIEHTPDPMEALTQMKRILKPGGLWVVTTPNKLWFPVLQLSQLLKVRKFEGNENWIWPHLTKKWLLENHLKIIFFGGCHLFPWQVPGAKKILPIFDNKGDVLYPLMINFAFAAIKEGPHAAE